MPQDKETRYKGYFNYYLVEDLQTLKSYNFREKTAEEVRQMELQFSTKAYKYVGKKVVEQESK